MVNPGLATASATTAAEPGFWAVAASITVIGLLTLIALFWVRREPSPQLST